MKKSRKWIGLLIFSAITVCSISGCKGINDKPAKSSEVMKAVKEAVPSEKYEYLSVVNDEESRPKVDTYEFRSKERDLNFSVVSTLAPFGIDGGTLGYSDSIRVYYADAVHELYKDRIDAVLGELVQNDRGRYTYSSFCELEKIVGTLVEADTIYREELAYNSKEWLLENPIRNVRFDYVWAGDDGDEKHSQIMGVDIDGDLDYKELYDLFAYRHAEAAKDGVIEDATVPESQLERVHREALGNIYINGVEISDSAYEDALSRRLINNLRDRKGYDNYSCFYYYPWKKYVIKLNLGLTDEEYAPQLMENYTKALGIPCKVKYKKGEISWRTEDAKWSIKARRDRNQNVKEFGIYKNGKKQDIKYLTADDEMSLVRSSYLVAISVDDFADIFDLEVLIDEDNGMISFVKAIR